MTRLMTMISIVTFCSSALHAAVALRGTFGNNMVLQQGVSMPVSGSAEDGEEVTVTFCGQAKSTTAKDGYWKVTLAPLAAGGPHRMTVKGNNTIGITNVLIGEVWICSGQSNMWRPLVQSHQGPEEAERATNPLIRHATVKNHRSTTLQTDITVTWEVCEPEAAKNFSATAYFFARSLAATRKVPVGVIKTAWNGTRIEPWTPADTLTSSDELRAVSARYAAMLAPHLAAHEEALQDWEAAKTKAQKEGSRFKKREPYESGALRFPYRPGELYNGMIAPLTSVPIAGVIWYQGESNLGREKDYAITFPAMIQSWRAAWGQEDLPFLWAQLAAFGEISTQPGDSSWANLRNAQAAALSLPQTAMAVLTDLGCEIDIHPSRKQEVGNRLALAARAIAYNEAVPYTGPTVSTLKRQGKTMHVTFTNTEEGLEGRGDGINPTPSSWPQRVVIRDKDRLVTAEQALIRAKAAHDKAPQDKKAQEELATCKGRVATAKRNLARAIERAAITQERVTTGRKNGLATRNAEDKQSSIKGFSICGADKVFVWAHAEIVKPDTVAVSSPSVPNPIAVRYAWENYPICNLYNKDGLPGVPFQAGPAFP